MDDTVVAGADAPIAPGNALPLSEIPPGTMVHNVELQPGRGGQLARSAGAGIQVMARDSGYVLLRMPSGEMRQGAGALPRDGRHGRQRRARPD